MMSDSQQPDPNLGYPDRETRNFDILGAWMSSDPNLAMRVDFSAAECETGVVCG